MNLNNLVFIITYCSLHEHFIDALLYECSKVSKKIMITVGTHLWDKSLEDDGKLMKILKKHPHVVIYKFDSSNIDLEYKDNFGNKISTKSRILGFKKALMKFSNVDWFFFLDSDEIPEGNKLKYFLENNEILEEKNYIFSTYWYFREPTYQALSIEQNPLLLYISNVKDFCLESSHERMAYLDVNFENSTLQYVSDNGTPLFHHYSWVMNKDLMLKKIQYTFKKKDHENLFKIVEEEFSKPFEMKDFIHKYDYKIVENIFNISTD